MAHDRIYGDNQLPTYPDEHGGTTTGDTSGAFTSGDQRAEIAELKRQRDDYLREAHDTRAWPVHREYARRRASDLQEQIAKAEGRE